MLCRQSVLHSYVWGLLYGRQLCSTLLPNWHPLGNALRDVFSLSLVSIQVYFVSTRFHYQLSVLRGWYYVCTPWPIIPFTLYCIHPKCVSLSKKRVWVVRTWELHFPFNSPTQAQHPPTPMYMYMLLWSVFLPMYTFWDGVWYCHKPVQFYLLTQNQPPTRISYRACDSVLLVVAWTRIG